MARRRRRRRATRVAGSQDHERRRDGDHGADESHAPRHDRLHRRVRHRRQLCPARGGRGRPRRMGSVARGRRRRHTNSIRRGATARKQHRRRRAHRDRRLHAQGRGQPTGHRGPQAAHPQRLQPRHRSSPDGGTDRERLAPVQTSPPSPARTNQPQGGQVATGGRRPRHPMGVRPLRRLPEPLRRCRRQGLPRAQSGRPIRRQTGSGGVPDRIRATEERRNGQLGRRTAQATRARATRARTVHHPRSHHERGARRRQPHRPHAGGATARMAVGTRGRVDRAARVYRKGQRRTAAAPSCKPPA